jgi:hypothetical protein
VSSGKCGHNGQAATPSAIAARREWTINREQLMEHDIIPLAGVLGFFITSAWMLKMWLDYRERSRALDKSKNVGAASDERLARVEQAVESIAIEIERVSEGQRFVTKLLNERAQPIMGEVPKAAQVRRVDTPH